MKRPDSRKGDLAFIHAAKRALGLDEGTYRTMLFTLTRKRSAAELDDAERARVKDHLRARGFERAAGGARSTDPAPGARGAKPVVAPDRQGLVDKLEALLAEGAKPWNYARKMALRMFGLQLEWCAADQLRRLVAALEVAKRRNSKKRSS